MLTVWARNGDGSIAGQVDTFDLLEVVVRWRDVGRWTLVTSDPDLVGFFADRDTGIVVRRDDQVLISGPVDYRSREFDGGTSTMTVSGPDDTTLLADRLALPDPSSTVAEQGTGADRRTGTPGDLIVGYVSDNLVSPAADRVAVPVGVPDVPTGLGDSATFRTRNRSLLVVAQSLADRLPGLGFRVAQQDDRTLGLELWEATDRRQSGALISAGTVLDWSSVEQWPEATRVVVGGGDARYERRFRLVADTSAESTWQRVVETFSDHRDIDGVTRVISSGVTASADGVVASITSGLTGEADNDTFTTTSAHGLSVGDKVRFTDKRGGAYSLSRGTFYWVKTRPSSTTFTLAFDPDGDTLPLDTDMTSGDLEVLDDDARWSFTTDEPHDLANGDEIRFDRMRGGKGLRRNYSYWVRDKTSTTFRLSTRDDLSTLVRFDTDVTSASVDVMDWDEADDEMEAAGQAALDETSAALSLRITVSDTPSLVLGRDLDVGDLVRAYPSGVRVDDRIVEATVTVTRDDGEQTVLWVGRKEDDPDERIERRARRFDRRLRHIEGAM